MKLVLAGRYLGGAQLALGEVAAVLLELGGDNYPHLPGELVLVGFACHMHCVRLRGAMPLAFALRTRTLRGSRF